MSVYRTDDTIKVVVSRQFATDLLGEIEKPFGKRALYPLALGENDAGSWQPEAVATRRSDAGFDDFVAIFRRVLP